VYYAETTIRGIVVMTLDGRYSFTVVNDLAEGVRAIALDPIRG